VDIFAFFLELPKSESSEDAIACFLGLKAEKLIEKKLKPFITYSGAAPIWTFSSKSESDFITSSSLSKLNLALAAAKKIPNHKLVFIFSIFYLDQKGLKSYINWLSVLGLNFD
jgi:hypothetical protein